MSYIVGHPIKHPGDFYGRFPQKKRFFEIISGPQTQSVTILGARRSGKTSFLRHVAHPDVMKQYLKQSEKYIMVYVDVSACKTPGEFYQRTIKKLNQALPNVERVNLWAAPMQNEVTMFHLESVLCQFPNQRIILLLDEFDKIRAGHFTQDFLTELRALASVWEYELACVTASYCDLYQLGADVGLPPTSPFYNIFYPTPIYMDGIARERLEQLIRLPAERLNCPFEPGEIEKILLFAGTLPFFVQATASAWVNLKRSPLPFDEEAVFSQLVSDLSSYFLQWWRQFSKIEQEVLVAIAQQRDVENMDFSEIEIGEVTRALKNFAFIDPRNGRPNGAIFQHWLHYLPGKVSVHGRPRSGYETTLAAPQSLTQTDLWPLYSKMMTHFNVQDMLAFCFEMGIDNETLSYQNKQELIRAILLRARRQNSMESLITLCQESRPHVSWLETV